MLLEQDCMHSAEFQKEGNILNVKYFLHDGPANGLPNKADDPSYKPERLENSEYYTKEYVKIYTREGNRR